MSDEMVSPPRAGILLHPTSLPGRHGVGDAGPEAIRFLDWAAAAGFSVWQILPLGPTGVGNSPYSALSVFAVGPLFVSPERLVESGLLPASALEVVPGFPEDRVDFDAARVWKERLLRRAWENAKAGADAASRAAREEAAAWAAEPSRAAWLGDWTLYAAIKERHKGRAWTDWDPPIAAREPDAMAEAARALTAERAYHAFVQWLAARHWGEVHAAARERGISILGDLPIYPAMDSAEVWARRDLFQFGADGRPESVAGVPPDYFSETGQLWGNPLYRWDRHEADGFAWWIARVRAALETCDFLRLDHFRAIAGYWAVPAGAKTATAADGGRWLPGPGLRFVEALRAALGGLPLVAEDLGDIDDGVRALLRDTGLPGMRVLQFGLLDATSTHHPKNHIANAVAYTGTHDNDTARGWFEALTAAEQARVLAEVGGGAAEISWSMIRCAMSSPARLAVAPMQDVLGLGSDARMNTPSEPAGNWTWRMRSGADSDDLAARLRPTLGARAGRASDR
ncbi:MAG TPA: 4-alpha-glucanotransferase [Candidatus Eisenbacteria bacterium]|nr:4-alpha-glucanotransferase [Candidatus Eisenbacteria bacterium]